MWFLLDSHRYFEQRSDVPFFQGLVSVFMNGGLTFMTTLVTLLWLGTADDDNIAIVIETVGLPLFTYSFFSSFIAWGAIATVFYLFIMWDGAGRIEFYSVLNMVGLGFAPLVFASMIELIATLYYSSSIQATEVATTTHILIGGEFGLFPAVGMMVVHTIMLLWSAHVWIGGVQQLGGVSPMKSTVAGVLMASVLWLELLVLALL